MGPDPNAQSAQIEGGVYLSGGALARSANFGSAHTSILADAFSFWPQNDGLILDGFTYDRFAESLPDTHARLDWLHRGSRRELNFYPQPYTQLATVLRRTGFEREARTVLYHRDGLISHDSIHRRWKKVRSPEEFLDWISDICLLMFEAFSDIALRWVVGLRIEI